MSQDAGANEGQLPTVPEKAVRRSDDIVRPSESVNEGKRYWRSSESAVPTRAPGSILARPSDDAPQILSPSHQQLTQWQPANDPHDPVINRPVYRRPSQDYTVYDDAEPSAAGRDYYLVPQNVENGGPYPRNDSAMQQPYRRHPVRESTETYRPLRSELAPPPGRRSLARPHWRDGYEDGPPTPHKRTQPRTRTNVYLVREGGGGDNGDGSLPPDEMYRLPFFSWLKGPAKNHFVAVLGEFVGTTMFLFFAFAGTLVANIGSGESAAKTTTNATAGFSPIVNLYVAVAFGFSLMVNVWIFFRVSGGLFNPAVTLGMVMTKTITYTRGFLLVAAQLVGAIVASFIVQVLFPSSFNVRTTLAPNTSIARGLIIEAILTAELVFTVFMLAKEKHKSTYMAPVGIGLALFVAELVGVFFTGGSLNPARSFGPCVATGKFDSDHWIYWVGPAMGAIAAFAFYRFIKILEYEMANPGQDAQDPEEAQMEKREAQEGRAEV